MASRRLPSMPPEVQAAIVALAGLNKLQRRRRLGHRRRARQGAHQGRARHPGGRRQRQRAAWSTAAAALAVPAAAGGEAGPASAWRYGRWPVPLRSRRCHRPPGRQGACVRPRGHDRGAATSRPRRSCNGILDIGTRVRSGRRDATPCCPRTSSVIGLRSPARAQQTVDAVADRKSDTRSEAIAQRQALQASRPSRPRRSSPSARPSAPSPSQKPPHGQRVHERQGQRGTAANVNAPVTVADATAPRAAARDINSGHGT